MAWARTRSRSGLDYDRWIRPELVHGLYAPDRRHRYVEDPKGTKPYVTEWNLDVFFRNFQKLFPEVLSAEHEVVEQGDNSLKVAWTLEAESFMKIAVRFSGTETFYFDPEGRISVAFAEWNPDALAEDIMQRHRASLAEAAAKARPI